METPVTQSLQENHKNVTEIRSSVYKQVTCDVDTNARVPAEGCMYIIFHGPTKRYIRYNLTIYQFNLTNGKDHSWATRYFLGIYYIFHEKTDQTNYVK